MNEKKSKKSEAKLANFKNVEVLPKSKLDKLKGGAGIEDPWFG